MLPYPQVKLLPFVTFYYNPMNAFYRKIDLSGFSINMLVRIGKENPFYQGKKKKKKKKKKSHYDIFYLYQSNSEMYVKAMHKTGIRPQRKNLFSPHVSYCFNKQL